MVVSLKTDLRFPIPGQQGHGGRIIHLIQIEKEKRGVDPEKFMAYIRSKVVGEEMHYLLLDEIQMLDCFEAVLNGYLRKDN